MTVLIGKGPVSEVYLIVTDQLPSRYFKNKQQQFHILI